MPTWSETVAEISSGPAVPYRVEQRRFAGTNRFPVVVGGTSGAGKTQLWSRLTGRSTGTPQTSVATDDGYMLRPHQQTAAIVTIPGQTSRSRFVALEELFGATTIVSGVVFVASYGFDRIWPGYEDAVASALPSFDLTALRERNLREEVNNFRDFCGKILQMRTLSPPENSPQWLLIAANKADLYWNQINDAESYYDLMGGSPFADVAQDLFNRIGPLGIRFSSVPLAVHARDYKFSSARGTLDAQSLLTQAQCDTSVSAFALSLGEIHGK